MMRLAAACILTLVAPLSLGCGEVPAAGAKKKPAPRKAFATPVVAPMAAPKVEQDDYANVEAAMTEVEALAKSSDETTSQKLLKIELWLNMQGAKIAPELEAMIKDPAVGLATRLTACRVLARQGPAAVPTLLEAAAGEPQQLRRKAIECLGRVKPTTAEAVHKLVALIDDPDYEMRKSGLAAIGNVGPPAKEHAPNLVEELTSILNNINEDETVRSLAKDALKKIDPRRGLMNAH